MDEISDQALAAASGDAGGGHAPAAAPDDAPFIANPQASTPLAAVAEEDEEGDVCRICRNPGDDANPLRYPCACSGSIKFVHQDCLLQWLDHSNSRQCEVCKHAFSFSPLYAANSPATLPFSELLIGVAKKACHVFQFIFRLGFVLLVWLVAIPFITYWIWRFTLMRSPGEAQKLFLSHLTSQLLLSDCLHGFLLSALIVFIFLAASSIRDYVRHLHEFGGHDADRNEGRHERHAAQAARRLDGPANGGDVVDGIADAAGDVQGIVNAGDIIRRNAENVAARLERLEAQVEQMLDGLDDADGAEDVPFDELVGMQGPILHLVENAVTVLASNAIFLIVVIFVPFSLGRIFLYYLSSLLSFASSPMVEKVVPVTGTALSLANITLKSALTAVKNLSLEGHNVGVATSLDFNITGLSSAAQIDTKSGAIKGISGSSHHSDVTTLAVGYLCIVFLIFLYVGSFLLYRYARGERLTVGRLYGMNTIAEALPSLGRQLFAGMKHIIIMVKVAFLLLIELGVFPLMCGWWLDVCTLKMLGVTFSQRVEFFSISPLASSSVHWLIGIIYMLHISIFVSLLRGVLRNGVLYFLRDPADPNYNPFRDLIDDPVHKHARRVLLSVVVYGSLIVLLVFLPVKLAMRLAPSLFPLDITIFDPFTEIPMDVLLFQICIPFAIEHFKPRATIKSVLHHWFASVGWALDLTDFLLPKPEENVQLENRNARVEIRGRVDAMQLRGELLDDQQLVAHVAEGELWDSAPENVDADEASESDGQADSEYGFALRIVLLLILAWMTLLIFNVTMIIVPISLGRLVFDVVPRLPIAHGIKCNDLLSFSIGCYIIWSMVAAIRYAITYIRRRRVGYLAAQFCKWSMIVLKSSALLSIWIFVIPILIGLLFELLVIVPVRVPIDESPVFLLYQDWALGLIFLKIWTRMVMLDHMLPLGDEGWRRKFERVRQDGFSRLRGFWVLHEIILPIVIKLLTALCVPYVFAKGIFPVLGYPLIVNSAVYRFAWLGCLVFLMLYFCARRFHTWFTNLHNSIRDDRYLIGRQLHNFGEEPIAPAGGATSSSQSHSSDPHTLLRLRRPNQPQQAAA